MASKPTREPLSFEVEQALKRLRLGSVSPYGVRRANWFKAVDTLEAEIVRLTRRVKSGA